ncbi:MAG: PAS domain-containing protein [Agarilytica sp.]
MPNLEFINALAQLQHTCRQHGCDINALQQSLCELLASEPEVTEAKVGPLVPALDARNEFQVDLGSNEYLTFVTTTPSFLEVYRAFIENVCSAIKQEKEYIDVSRRLDLYSNIIDATHDGYWEWKPSENYSYFSEKLKTMLGFSEKEIGNDLGVWKSLIHPDDIDDVLTSAKKILEYPTKYHEIEFRMRCKNGSYKWLLSRGKAVKFHSDGKVAHIVGTHIDIQDMKELEESLRRANEDLFLEKELATKASELARMGSWEVNVESGSVFWSDSTKKIHGVKPYFEPDLEAGINFYKEGWSRDRITEVFQACVETGEPFDEELILVTESGEEKWVRALGDKDQSKTKETRIFGLFQDIDESKRTLDALEKAKESESALFQRLKLARDAAEIGVWDWDLVTNELNWDEWMYRVNDLAPDDFETTVEAMQHCLHEDDVEFLRHQVKDALDGVKPLDTEFRINKRNGDIAYIKTKGSVIRNENGDAERMIGVNYDITASKSLQLEQERAREAAEEANEAKSKFLANMSHEIRTPMNGVLGMLHLVLQNDHDDKTKRKLNIALKSAKSLLTIINDILDFSKIEANKLVLEKTNFLITDVIENCINNVVIQANKKEITLNSDLGEAANSYLKGDPVRVEQIINNLLSNAVKFTEKGSVTISVGLVDYGRISKFSCDITDTGIGIPKDKQGELFEAFSQVDASTTRKFGGTGLGLAICKKLCDLMEGTLNLTSEDGQGTTFSFEIHFDNADEHFEPNSNKIIKNQRILVVDDESFGIHSCIRILLKLDASIECITPCDIPTYLKNDVSGEFLADVVLFSDGLYTLEKGTYGPALSQLAHRVKQQLIIGTAKRSQGEQGILPNAIYIHAPILPSTFIEALASIQRAKVITNKSQQEINGEAHTTLAAQILVVDDNEINRVVTKGLLEEHRLDSELAENGEEALNKLLASPSGQYKLILMDVQMPVMNGYEATQKIRAGHCGEQLKGVTIVAMTANAMVGDKEKCLEAGMNDYLAKPLDPAEFEKTLKRYFPS